MYDVIIIGAGPAGLMAANVLKDTNYLVLEKMEKAGKKLLITGGGRCNLTNLKDNQTFLEEIEHNKKSLFSTLHNFGPYDIYDYFHPTVPLTVVEEDQVFPVSNKASDILKHLLKDIKKNIVFQVTVKEIKDCKEYIELVTNKQTYLTKKVVVASGGASYSMTGSSGDHMHFARLLQQPTIPLFPAETSIVLQKKNNLAGTSFDHTSISFGKVFKTGHLMFTHNGISGLAAMKSSEYVHLQNIKEIFIDFDTTLSKETIENSLEQYREKEVQTILSTFFTKKFSEFLATEMNFQQVKCKQLTKADKEKIVTYIKAYPCKVQGAEKIEKAYVCGGGIDVKGLNMKTFASKIHPNISFAGECVDIHGPIGGYNLTLAMSSGYSAGLAIKEELV